MIVYDEDGVQLYEGDVLDVLAQLPADSVDCVVTSPPYWSLRAYSGEQSRVWGGDPACEHEWQVEAVKGEGYTGTARWQHSENGRGEGQPTEKRLRDPITREARPEAWTTHIAEHGFCRCGAWRGQYGLEPQPELYVEHTVMVLRAIRRVLKPTGVCWWNIGDSYAGSNAAAGDTKTTNKGNVPSRGMTQSRRRDNAPVPRSDRFGQCAGLKPKDLVLIPQRVALAAQADGWYVRADVIWSKPNPMPESVRDRPTKAHEYVLLLARGQEASSSIQFADLSDDCAVFGNNIVRKEANVRSHEACIRLATAILDGLHPQEQARLLLLDPKIRQQSSRDGDGILGIALPPEHRMVLDAARLLNAETSPKEFVHALRHYVDALRKRRVGLIGRGPASVLNAPRIDFDGKTTITVHDSGEVSEFDFVHNQIVSRWHTTCTYFWDQDAVREPGTGVAWNSARSTLAANGVKNVILNQTGQWRTAGADTHHEDIDRVGRNICSVWTMATQPSPLPHFASFPEELPERCIKASCPSDGIVLDPFAGTGTTLKVARDLGRKAIGIEISDEYAQLAIKRLRYGVRGTVAMERGQLALEDAR